jgi:hypothetical protein
MQASKIAKVVFAGVALFGFVHASSAIIAVNWAALEGFYKSDGSTALLGGAGTQTALAQLIFSTDAVAGPVDVGALHYTSGNDTWLADWTVDAVAFSTYGEFAASTFTQAWSAGYLYVRVFDQGSMSGLSNQMWYYNSPFTNAIDNTTDPTSPDAFNISAMTGAFGDTLNQQVVIPEPATLAFLFIGIVALAGRKFRRG